VNEEKVRPFTLVKYFTYSSLAVIFIGILVLSILNAHWAKAMQLKKSEDYAYLLIENLNHQIFSQFVIPMAIKFGKIQLRNKEQFERLDKIVQSTFHSFNVASVTIYDIQNIVSYSLDPELIGKEDIGGPEYYEALEGNASSALEQDGNFVEILLGIPHKSKLVTFAPLRAERPLSKLSGPVMGVVEIVQDLSEDYKTIFRFQIRILTTCTVVMLLLFLILIQVVNRGEGIIRQRNFEQIRLKEQLSRAERLSSSLGEMIAGISHEIRNPLGIIRSSAELLRKKMLRFDPANSIPNIIVEESTRLNNIITDFLSVAKPKEPALRLCRIEEVLEKNISFSASQTAAYGHRIGREYADGLPEIMIDPDMLYQAFLNILMNAMQAMPDGGEIRVKTYKTDQFVTILFEDDGVGIPKDVLPKIWDPFFSTKDTGTGLGLGIVKNIIEAHHGKIYIQNGNEKGALVRVELPITQEET